MHTQKDILKNSGGCFYFIQQKKKTAATSELTTEQKLTFTLCRWNDDWHSGAVRLEDASDTCTRIHWCAHLGRHPPTHPHTHAHLHLHQLFYTCGCSNSNRFTIPPFNVVSQRGEGSPLDLCSLLLPSSEVISGLTGDITQRPQPYISMVHRQSNVTPSNNTARPATGLEGGVLGVSGQVMLWPKGGQGGVGHRPRRWCSWSLGGASGGLRGGGRWWWTTAV